MRIAVVHGYFLQGTGSNLFVANLSRELCAMGHEVLLFSQEQHPEKLDFVSRHEVFAADNRTTETRFERNTGQPGACLCYRPNLDGRLPVYVYDNYPGYQVKTFTELTTAEIEEYIAQNQTALATVLAAGKPDLILSNHTVMQPVYVNRARQQLGLAAPHCVTVHGSCLNFAVRHSELLRQYAQEAVAGAQSLVFVSEYSKQEFSSFFGNAPDIDAKARVIPAGVDIGRFQPLAAGEEKTFYMEQVVAYLRKEGVDRKPVVTAPLTSDPPEQQPESTEMWRPDAAAAERIASVDWRQAPLVIYYGKYLWTKGVQLLVGAAPLVLAEHPDTRFVLVGFGSLRPYLEKLIAALDEGREDVFRSLLGRIGEWYPEAESAAGYFAALNKRLDDADFARDYFAAARGKIGERVILTGFMPHEYLHKLIACAEISVAPSIFPEAFGLVGVEAIASGVIPLQTNHTGFAEVIQKYTDGLKDLFPGSGLKPLLLDEALLFNLAGNINWFLHHYSRISPEERQKIRSRARDIALEYSWSNMALKYVSLVAETTKI